MAGRAHITDTAASNDPKMFLAEQRNSGVVEQCVAADWSAILSTVAGVDVSGEPVDRKTSFPAISAYLGHRYPEIAYEGFQRSNGGYDPTSTRNVQPGAIQHAHASPQTPAQTCTHHRATSDSIQRQAMSLLSRLSAHRNRFAAESLF